jgi:polar amino acid transport system substrate-binding protein
MNIVCRIVSSALILTTGTIIAAAQDLTPEVLKELAPTGKLRAGINFGNAVLAQRDAAGKPKGVTPEISIELGRRIGLPVELVTFEAAGKTSRR